MDRLVTYPDSRDNWSTCAAFLKEMIAWFNALTLSSTNDLFSAWTASKAEFFQAANMIWIRASSLHPVAAPSAATKLCTYCGTSGHLEARCFKRRNDQRRKKATSKAKISSDDEDSSSKTPPAASSASSSKKTTKKAGKSK